GRALKCEGVLLAAGCGIGGGELEQTRAGLIDISAAGPEARAQVEHGRARFASAGVEKRAGVSAGAEVDPRGGSDRDHRERAVLDVRVATVGAGREQRELP